MQKYFKVIHLELKETHTHHYFGSIKAMCDNFGKEQIGITYSYARNLKLHETKFYENNLCVIRQGELVTTPKKTE